MGKHEYTKFDRARDEMMSHVIRCDVLDADMDHREEWLAETMEYMAERYPMLSELEMTKLEMVGKQFIKPPIPHGRGNTARSRDNNIEELVESELTPTAETVGVDEVAAPEEVAAPDAVAPEAEVATQTEEGELAAV